MVKTKGKKPYSSSSKKPTRNQIYLAVSSVLFLVAIGIAFVVFNGSIGNSSTEGFNGNGIGGNGNFKQEFHKFVPPNYQQLKENTKEITQGNENFEFTIQQVLVGSQSCYLNSPDPLQNDIHGIATFDKYEHSLSGQKSCLLTIKTNTFDVQTDIKRPNGKYSVVLKNKKGEKMTSNGIDLKLVDCYTGQVPCQTIQGPPNAALHAVIPRQYTDVVRDYLNVCLYYEGKELLRGSCFK